MSDISSITLPNNQTHTFKDAQARNAISQQILVQETQPTATDNKLWIDPEGDDDILIPTYEEFQALETEVSSKTAIDLGVTGANVGQFMKVKTVDVNGKPTAWETEPIKYTLTVTAQTQDSVTVTGQTVIVREGGADGQVFATAAYDGQPVSFAVPVGFAYHVSVSDNLASHFNPTTATGIVTNTNIAVTLTYSDFSNIRTARDIQAALNSDIDLTELVGEQITCPKGNSTLTWDVADYDEAAKEITLMTYETLPTQMQFELPQALAYFEEGLAAGNYKFKNGNTYYYFTLTNAIPEGGQLRATTSTFQVYASQATSVVSESGTVGTEELTEAVDLGTCGSETGTYPLNSMERVNNGSNNIGESGLLQWINSTAEANEPMPRLTKFSRPYIVNVAGFLSDLDPDFLDVISETDWKCASNSTYECPASLGGICTKQNVYTVRAKFCLASEKEIFGSYTNLDAGDHIFDLYKNAVAADRIKRYNNGTHYWWLRTPNTSASYVRGVRTNGTLYSDLASSSCGVVPVCKIKKSV